MADYIKREGILADIDELKKSSWYTHVNGHLEREEAIDIVTKLCVLKQPTADVAPVVHARHRGEEMVASFRVQRCSYCGEYTPIGYYCYFCGAKMDGGVDDG